MTFPCPGAQSEQPESEVQVEIQGTQVAGEVTGEVAQFLGVLAADALSRTEAQVALDLKSQVNFRDRYLGPALEADLIEMTIPDKPHSSKQRYRLTAKGKTFLEQQAKEIT